MSTFKINQKVICVISFEGQISFDEGKTWIKTSDKFPVVNEVYRIRDIDEKGWLVLFGFREIYFNPEKFRPLDESFAEEIIKKLEEHIEDVEEFHETIKEHEQVEI